MRSRWRGSMFAWILNTKPVNGGSVGSTTRASRRAAAAAAPSRTSACRISRTPKLLMPEPKNTGLWRPARNSASVERWLAPRSSSMSSRSAPTSSGDERVELRVVEARDRLGVVGTRSSPGAKRMSVSSRRSNTPLEAAAHADRPGDRRAVDAEHRLDLLEQLERLAHLAVHLVDEREDRRVAHAAHLEQLDRLRLDALGGVDQHHRGVDRGQHAVGVLGEVLVARRVEQVDRVAGVLELHHRARDRDAALLLDLHPVGGRVARALARLDRAGELDRAAEQQQLLGQRRLARVRVRDDRERAPLRDVARERRGRGGRRRGDILHEGMRLYRRDPAPPRPARARGARRVPHQAAACRARRAARARAPPRRHVPEPLRRVRDAALDRVLALEARPGAQRPAAAAVDADPDGRSRPRVHRRERARGPRDAARGRPGSAMRRRSCSSTDST